MKRKLSIVYLVMTATFAVGRLSAQGNHIAAQAAFRDATAVPTDKIRSDDQSSVLGAYPDGTYCVIDYRGSGGFYFLRTAKSSCTPPVQRRVKLDFSDAISRTPDGSGIDPCHVNDALGQPGELNICGLNDLLPDVRLIANTLFSNSALNLGTAVALHFGLIISFSGPSAFSLEFEQSQGVTASGTNARTVTAGATAVAELYKNNTSNSTRISLGRFKMPFQVTVTAPVP